MSKKANTIKSFSHAFDGLKLALTQEPNFKIHVLIASLVIISGLIFRITKLEWSILLFAIFFVLMMELLNTVLEAIVDLVQPTFHKKAKIAKDVAAAGVLMAAIVATIIYVIIFYERFIALV